MTTRFSPLFLAVLWAVCLTFLLNVSAVFATDHLGPVFPRGTGVNAELEAPLPLPRNNSLLQRPQNRQVVFDDFEPGGTVIPQGLFFEEDTGVRPQIVRQQQMPQQMIPRVAPMIETDNALFMGGNFVNNGEILHSRIISDNTFEMGGCTTSSFPVPFGMGLFDNITLFGEATTFKTGLSEGMGSLGISEGINWSFAATPQGAVTAQYGVRAVQADFNIPSQRNQFFMTAGLFKRFDFARVQGGMVVDLLQDRAPEFGNVKLRQMRYELSTRIFDSLECGFIGCFDISQARVLSEKDVGVHDHYLFFVRKHVSNGGQLEIRGGATAWGDAILHALGEIAISDRLAVNGGLSVLIPSGGRGFDTPRSDRECWSMSMGIVLYFRGGAIFRQANMHRPMFDVASNNSFFTRIIR